MDLQDMPSEAFSESCTDKWKAAEAEMHAQGMTPSTYSRALWTSRKVVAGVLPFSQIPHFTWLRTKGEEHRRVVWEAD